MWACEREPTRQSRMSSTRPQPPNSSSSFGNGSTASTILGAFGRRPRTGTNSRDRQGLPAGLGTDYATSTDDLNLSGSPQHAANRSRISLVARSGLPRSNSSSQVNRVNSPVAFPSSANQTSDSTSRRPGMTSHNSFNNRPQTSGAAEESNGLTGFPRMMRTNSSQGNNNGNGGSGSAIGRYLRRYSQGAGKNMAAANEAYAIASASNSSNAQDSANNQNGGGSAIPSSQTMAALSTSNLHDTQGTNSTDGGAESSIMMSGNRDERRAETTTTSTSSNTHRIRLVPHLEATRSLHFEPIERDLVEGAIAVKIGRFTDRANPSTTGPNGSVLDSGSSMMGGGGGNASMISGTATGSSMQASGSSAGVPGARGGAIPSSAGGGGRVDSGRIAFKSKVVSRGHAEVWCEAGGKVS